jgi:hypothetical protein
MFHFFLIGGALPDAHIGLWLFIKQPLLSMDNARKRGFGAVILSRPVQH